MGCRVNAGSRDLAIAPTDILVYNPAFDMIFKDFSMPNNDVTDRINKTPEYWRKKNSYYYKWLDKVYIANVRPGSRVLHVGCEAGDFLAAVKPSYGVIRGIESVFRFSNHLTGMFQTIVIQRIEG